MKNQKRWRFPAKIFYLITTTCIWVGLVFGGALIPLASASQLQNIAGKFSHLSKLLEPDGTRGLNNGYLEAYDTLGWRMVRSLAEAAHFAPLTSVDGHWDQVYGLPGMNSRVMSLTLDGSGSVYAGGDFLIAGNLIVNHVALWDGISWSALGSGANGRVNTLGIDSTDNLYIGGDFTDAGGVTANRVAMWDGSTWSPLGTGMNNSVTVIVLDGNGGLYAGGAFTMAGGVTANRVARWDGSAWYPLGSGMNGIVNGLALDSSGNLYAGGEFTTAGGNSANYIAKWDGSVWSPLGGGMSGFVDTLEVDEGNNLYAGGNFISADGVTVNRVAMWDGSAWFALDGGMNSRVFNLEYAGNGHLYAAGHFTTAGGNEANYVAKWDGNVWSPLGSGLNAMADSLISGSGSTVYVGGVFSKAGVINALRVATWNGVGWSNMGDGKGTDANVLALAVVGDEEFYAGGDFLVAGDQDVNRIAHWDGSDWSLLWGGMTNSVRALAYDINGYLYAGGAFTSVGGLSANRIARWNGAVWSTLSTGLNNLVRALVLDGSGNLYAGGHFTTAGGTTVNYVAKWDGSSWSALGSGMNSYVTALAIDGNGYLYAGGNFTTAGGVSANHVAMWDGSTWSPLGTGMDNLVSALEVDDNNKLYAGGSFLTAGGNTANRIAMWDGVSWSSLGSGMNNTVEALLATQGGYLYAGGSFNMAGGTSANRLALWNGSAWSPLGSGLNTVVRVLELDGGGNLYVGGDFTYAGGKPSYHIARWFNDPPVAVDDGYTMIEDSLLTVGTPGVLANDADINLDPLAANLEGFPPTGDINFLTDGSFVYTPTLNYNGVITFTYSITDGFGGADLAQVAITITAVNDPPVAEDDVANVDEDTPISLAVLSNDIDADEDVLYVESITLPTHGSAVISDTTHVFYTPTLNYYGMDVFTYTVSDGVITDSAMITLTVAPVNDAPLALNDIYETDEDIPLSVPVPGVLDNDLDVENQPLSAVLDSYPLYGDLDFTSPGNFVYTPTLNYHGVDNFTYHATDGITDSNTATVYLVVNSINDPPEAMVDYYNTYEDTPLDVEAPGVLENDSDVDGDDLIAALFSGPLHGVLTLYQDGSFQYSPEENYHGEDIFTYTVTDVNSGTHSAQAYIMIASVNDMPLVDAGEDQTIGEGELAYFLGTFNDPGLFSNPTADEGIKWDFGDGMIITGTLVSTHTYADNGTYTVTLTVTDTEGGVGQDALIVTVENEAPKIAEYGDEVSYLGESMTITLSFTDPGLLDTHMVDIQWGDGISDSLDIEVGERQLTTSHIYQDKGLYTATISILDDDGGADQVSFKVDVILPGNKVFLPVVSRQ